MASILPNTHSAYPHITAAQLCKINDWARSEGVLRIPPTSAPNVRPAESGAPQLASQFHDSSAALPAASDGRKSGSRSRSQSLGRRLRVSKRRSSDHPSGKGREEEQLELEHPVRTLSGQFRNSSQIVVSASPRRGRALSIDSSSHVPRAVQQPSGNLEKDFLSSSQKLPTPRRRRAFSLGGSGHSQEEDDDVYEPNADADLQEQFAETAQDLSESGKRRSGGRKSTDVERVNERMLSSYVVLDIRSAAAFRKEHVPGAINCPAAPLWSFRTRLERMNLPNTADAVIVVSRASHQSNAALKAIEDAGYYVVQLDGGMKEMRRQARASGLFEANGTGGNSLMVRVTPISLNEQQHGKD